MKAVLYSNVKIIGDNIHNLARCISPIWYENHGDQAKFRVGFIFLSTYIELMNTSNKKLYVNIELPFFKRSFSIESINHSDFFDSTLENDVKDAPFFERLAYPFLYTFFIVIDFIDAIINTAFSLYDLINLSFFVPSKPSESPVASSDLGKQNTRSGPSFFHNLYTYVEKVLPNSLFSN